ncbi:TonB family protein [Candidatus Xiphinematobacter sp. Idaho Grape]|uniref:TonB family protein n=1 Tax=Candidatus Xiphinematobacter sp. Idaho Grape TaxID=1704307 RepID=UPI00403D7038
MIHDRFYSQWDQPIALFGPQYEFSCVLEVQIAQDGSIADYQIVGGSGNEVLDRSVLEASARVKQIDPLPVGLRESGVYTVRVEFKFSS